MERRREIRYAYDTAIRLTVIGDESGEWANGRLVDISTSGLSVLLSQPLQEGCAVRVEVEDNIVYGFVVHCQALGYRFRLGFELQEVLLGGSNLSNLIREVASENPRVVVGSRD